jgi:hypothetical protein
MNSIAEHKIFTPFTIGRVSLRHSNRGGLKERKANVWEQLSGSNCKIKR